MRQSSRQSPAAMETLTQSRWKQRLFFRVRNVAPT